MKYIDRIYFVYGKDNCPWCADAVELLKRYKMIPVYLNLSEHPEWRRPEWKTVPQVFTAYQHVGGYSELAVRLANG